MADKPGTIESSVLVVALSNNNNNGNIGIVDFNRSGNIFVTSSVVIGTGRISATPVTYITSVETGIEAESYADIFYNRILVEPIFISLGNLITERQFTITVFNSYFENRTFDSLSGSNLDGILLTGPTVPLTLGPLQEIEYNLTVSLEGPPQINASYVLDFQGTEDDVTISITGNRIVLYPYLFQDQMTESLGWLTDIIKSNDGTEQRIKTRRAPRQSFAIQSFLDINENARGGNLLYGWRKREWAFPIFSEQRNISAPVIAGQNTVTADTSNASFRENGLAVLYKNERVFDVFLISTVAANSLITDQPIRNNYDESDIIVPVKIVRMTSDPRRTTRGWSSFLSANVEVIENFDEPVASSAITQYKNLDVLLENQFEIDKPGNEYDVIYSHRIDEIDFQTGKIEYVAPHTYTELRRTIRFFLTGLEEIWDFRGWLHRRSGRLVPFWMPSFENDFSIVTEGALGVSFLVENYQYQTQAFLRTNIIVFINDGTFLLREIVGSTLNAQGFTEISVNSSINFIKEEILYISYLGQYRLDTDTVRLRWLQDNKATCDLLIREISP